MDITDLISSSKQEASSKQAASKQARAKWGNITPPLWCLGFGQNFGGCYLWVQNLCTLAANTPQTKKQTISQATWLKMQCQAHLTHPQPPTFGGFHPSKLPYPTPGPPYLGPVGCGKLQEVAHRGGCKNGSTRSTGCEKMTFFKNDLGPHGMPRQVVLARFELMVARFGPPKIAKCLENRLFWDQKSFKNGSKKCFSKNDTRPFGVPQQVK